MGDEIQIIILAVFGIIGYLLLFFGTKEPRHKYGNLIMAIYGVCLITMVVAGLFVHWHNVFWWQGLPAFYAVYGFAAFVFLIYAAKGLRPLLQKKEDYYETKGAKER